jgi:hypothetical protein
MPKKTQTKSDFVRSLPMEMPAKDVVAKARAKGIKLSTKHVYVIRSLEKKRTANVKAVRDSNRKARAHSAVVRGDKAGGGPGIVSPEDAVQQFKVLVARLGTDKARSMLASVEASL